MSWAGWGARGTSGFWGNNTNIKIFIAEGYSKYTLRGIFFKIRFYVINSRCYLELWLTSLLQFSYFELNLTMPN